MKRLLLTLLILLCGAAESTAQQPPQCIFQTYSTLDGLTHDRIADIYTDSRGFVWVCTWYGVSRFDGYSFKNFSTAPGDFSPLSHHRFISVSEDSNGHLWFTTYNFHVYRLNRFTEQFEDVVSLIEGVDSNHYRASHCLHDGDGGTWVAISGLGVARFADAPDASPVLVDAFFDTPVLGGEVTAMYVDDRNNAWIAAADGQLNYIAAAAPRRAITLCETELPGFSFAADSGAVYCATPQEVVRADKRGRDVVRISGATSDLTAIAADTARREVYVGSRNGDLYRIARSHLARLTPRGPRPSRIRDLAADSHGILWVTTPRAGITRYNPSTDDYKHFEQKPYTVSYNLDTITKIAEGGGRLWIKMNQYGFGYYDRKRDLVLPFYNDPGQPNCQMTNAVVRFDVQDDVLWLSTYNERGLRKAVLLRQPADVFTLDSDSPNPLSGEIRALMNDRRGRLWVGTRDGELIAFDADYNPLYRLPVQGRGTGMIYTLKEDSSGCIWVGTKGEGLYRLKPAGGGYAVTHYVHSDTDPYSLNDNQIYCVEEDATGRIWIATYGGGINILDEPDSGRFIHAGNQLAHYPLDEAGRVRWLLSDTEHRMFAATVDGLLVFDPSVGYRQMRFDLVQKIPGDVSSLGNNDIIHMCKDSAGHIWLATYGGGLNLIDAYDEHGRPRFRCFGQESGLSSNICMAVTEDHAGDIWVSTHNAVSRFDPHREVFSNYNLYDDMRNAILSEATTLTTPSGHVLFGGRRQIFRFDPEQVRSSKIDYDLHFTRFYVRNHPVVAGPGSPLAVSVSEADRVALPYDFSNFRMEFASLNYAIQHAVGYMYKLEGYDRDWNIAGTTNRASYSNLPIGHYRFHVKAFVGNTAAADDGIAIAVDVLPPFWLTWWAKTIYVLLALTVLAVILRTANSVLRIRRQAKVEQDLTDLKLRFFTNISHELRTPLTLILGGIEDVRRHDKLSERGESSLTLAYRNAKRMLSLINQLLDFRKIVKNKMELKISRVDLVPVVEDAIEDFREMAAERHIELLFTVSRRSILVWVDIERMESVIYNLLSNAMKFTPNGGKVEVILSQRDEEECVLLTVRDTGIGIPKDKQGAIFERFAQASRAVDPNMKGSGIGLSLCRDIVALHHGEITLESRPGEGSAFTVRLRLGNAHFGMDQIDFSGASVSEHHSHYMVSDYTSAESQRRTDVTPPKDAPKILLVEDNRELRIFMYNSLIDTYHVVEAEDGVEALEKIRSEMPDIIVTDLMMPRMDGIELIDKVRHDFTMSHIPIIMLTARHSPDDRVKAMEYGADGYITKPFSIELLLARIDNLLTQRRKLFEKFSSQAARNKAVELVVEDVVVTDRDEEFMKEVMSWLADHIENSDLTIDQLASHLGLGRTTMYNKLKSLTGKSPVELIKEYRITKSRMLLGTGQFSVSEVAYKVGFSDPGYFSRCFREQYHMSPAEYLKTHNLKQKNETK